jgi:hypothetical protein
MIATSKRCSAPCNDSAATAAFVAMLPKIRRKAAIAFHEFDPEAREDAIEEVVANCFVAFARLVAQGRSELAYATPLAQYAIKQFRDGRRVGSRLSVRDVMSGHAQRVKQFQVVSLNIKADGEDEIRAALVEDKTAGPADTAAARIDFLAWRRRLPVQLRKLSMLLARGETTKEAAEQFRVSTARISQLRSWLKLNWESFQGTATA